MRSHFASTLLLLLAAGCAAPHAEETPPPDLKAPTSAEFEGWASETFPLPPGFAPGLPTGVESLRFPPGWRDPSAEFFWSYTFVMWIDASAPDAARVDALLEGYYDGLMTVFAAGRDIGSDPAQVEVRRTAPNHFEAQMHVIDAFATFEPIDVRVVVDTVAEGDARTALRIQVSPRPQGHAIWPLLAAANAELRAP